MYSDAELVGFYEAAFGPLQNPDPAWLADLIVWCRKIIVAESLQEAASVMMSWAADGDIKSARESAARLREAAFPSEAPARPPPIPPDDTLRRWLQATTRPGWRWWAAHSLPVYIEDGPGWRRIFADGEVIRAWTAAHRRICPDLEDAAVRGWAKGCLDS